MSNNTEKWSDIPKRVHPVRCDTCTNSWFVRTYGIGGVNDREFWPRFCCYCGVRFVHTTEHDESGKPSKVYGMDGTPLQDDGGGA